jgi:hypothetical protein
VHNSTGIAAVKKVAPGFESDLKMIDLPTPQVTPDNTPRHSPVQSNLTLQFQSYVPPPIAEYQQRPVTSTNVFPKDEENDYGKRAEPEGFRGLESDRFASQMMDYRQQEMKNSNMMSFPPPIRTDRMQMDRYQMNPPPMLQIHDGMNGGMSLMSPTYTSTPTMTGHPGSYSPSMISGANQMSYLHHSIGQIPSPEEIHSQGMMNNDMNYQARSFDQMNDDMYSKSVNRREPPPRINTQLPMYSQPLTGQYPAYSFKQPQQDDRRFSAPILSPVYNKENQMNGFGMPYEQNTHRQ